MVPKATLVCSTPKSYEEVDLRTGEIITKLYTYIHPATGLIKPVPCGNKTCKVCGIVEARKLAGAIALAQPTHQFCVTRIGVTSKEINKRLSKFSEIIRGFYPTFGWVWSAEQNPGGTGAHAHGYYHLGDDPREVSPVIWARACAKAGIGSESLVDAVPYRARATHFSYPMKSLVDDDLRGGFLDLNGSSSCRKLIHASRSGFFRDGKGGLGLTLEDAKKLSYGRK